MLFGLLSFLLMSGSVCAQELTIALEPDAGAQGARVGVVGPVQGPDIGLIAIEPFDFAPPVKDAPYTAEAITETTQVFADGNRIEQRTSATVARDRSGRIRRQQEAVVFGGLVAKSQGPLVTISDPAGVHITLDPERRIAHRIKTPPLPLRGDFEVTVPPGGGGSQVARRGRFRFSIGDGPPAGLGQRRVEVGVERSDDAPAAGAPRGTDVRTEQLEARDIEGVRAEGTRTTITVQANTIGNQLPITIVSERWYSPELQVVVLTRRSDPRFGDTVYRLVNIVRGEPSADLFEIPSDYRIEEQTVTPDGGGKPRIP
jgi:hypothetical protein